MSRITELIAQVRARDPIQGEELEREFRALSSRLSFGLNFERHRPEAVELPGRRVRRGDKVRVLPPRGSTEKGDQRLWLVKKLHKQGKPTAELELIGAKELKGTSASVEDLVVVAEFRDVIYPGLLSTGKVERGGGKPYHTVIKGENYHALKALSFTHRGKVDAIYIDPPYNTGARDWKYNNDYVEGDDLYRHSKWLAMMERRLELAKELLNPVDSVLIVTIDEKECSRLGLLLEQLFPEAIRQMVTIVIQAAGSNRKGELGRVEEYAYFLFFGSSVPHQSTDDLLNEAPSTKVDKVRWESLLRSGTDSERRDSPNLFYPVFVSKKTGAIVGCGDSKPVSASRSAWRAPAGATPVFPLKSDDSEGRWRCSPETLRELVTTGFARAGSASDDGRGTIWYLGESARRKVESGEFAVTGVDAQGAKIVAVVSAQNKTFPIKTVWNRARHHAGWHGTNLIGTLLPGRSFPFPKSLYAVEDALRIVVGNKPNATVLDFFAGSGTTAHAVMRLNKQDGGARQCISVTNNEVSASEAAELRRNAARPGDVAWEERGICDLITKPRIQAAITGKTPSGEPIAGDYKFTDEFPISDGFEESAEFFTLVYETLVGVGSNLAFTSIAPLLWLRAGSRGKRIERLPSKGWDVGDTYGMIVDLDHATPFIEAVSKAKDLRIAYIFSDDERRFQAIARALPSGVEPIRLYESYLTNFSFTSGGE